MNMTLEAIVASAVAMASGRQSKRRRFGIVLCCAAITAGTVGCSGSPTTTGPVPSISEIAPATRYQSQPGFTLTVTGSNFLGSATVRWNGSPRPTIPASGSTTQLFAQIPASDLASAGAQEISVVNSSSGAPSNSVAFTVQPLTPGGFPLLQSVSTSGAPGNNESVSPAISADGRFVAFYSLANNFFSGTLNGAQIYVHDNCLGAASSCAPSTGPVSLANDGSLPNFGVLSGPVISGDGRYIAFNSFATNLVPNSSNGFVHAYLRDPCEGPAAPANCSPSTILISVNSGGALALGDSTPNSISGDGRFVVFSTDAGNLVPNDTNTVPDVFIRDTCLGTSAPVGCTPSTILVSADNNGNIGNGTSSEGAITRDGRYVAFESGATNLAGTIPFNSVNVFLRDTCLGPNAPSNCAARTTLLSKTPIGSAVANSFSGHPAIDSDARFIVFQSDASGLTPLATNGTEQIILADTCLGPIVPVGCAPSLALISVNPSGAAGNSNSFSPWVSKTGRFVGFSSNATDLVPNDTNGHADAFVRDTWFGAPAGCTPVTARVSLSASGAQGDADSGKTSLPGSPVFITDDGRFSVFVSQAKNFVPTAQTSQFDIFLALTPF